MLSNMGRPRQEQLEQAVARTEIKFNICPALAGSIGVRSERDTHFVQEEELLAHMRLLSSEAKDEVQSGQ